MAFLNASGKVVCKEGDSPVSLKQGDNYTIASFSLRDQTYCYFKNKDDNPGQFFRCEVTGKQATLAAERLKRGDRVSVVGQAVWRQYNGNKFLDIKNCQITFLEDNRETKSSDELF